MKNLVFCTGYSFFLNLQKEDFRMQRVWHSPNMLPTLIHGQAFRIITWQPPSRGLLSVT